MLREAAALLTTVADGELEGDGFRRRAGGLIKALGDARAHRADDLADDVPDPISGPLEAHQDAGELIAETLLPLLARLAALVSAQDSADDSDRLAASP
jgi:protein-tyrosine phosphatase